MLLNDSVGGYRYKLTQNKLGQGSGLFPQRALLIKPMIAKPCIPGRFLQQILFYLSLNLIFAKVVFDKSKKFCKNLNRRKLQIVDVFMDTRSFSYKA